ncbi:hypothetical protein SD427_10990 [Chryseobacterium sp. JJR-5R]|uniref:hypothetical protein n=1 Tax=Chryseobacterium sp. JJR-5R TaxID=3093923 RepID=UPI002A7616A7|nr:hypothetical protein [Chryseobacterium sp. JJR-5R]WPO81288.1 hypothetical protein SD427_10990 [Chryseobacterium sp. JJR-5R]
MKKTVMMTAVLILITLTECTKSETQYKDQDNKKETVNDRASDTVRTLQEESHTLQAKGNPLKVQTDNE